MKNIGTFLVLVFFIISCKAPTGAEDIGDIDRIQPDKVESTWDTPSDPDQIDLQSDTTSASVAERPFRYYSKSD